MASRPQHHDPTNLKIRLLVGAPAYASCNSSSALSITTFLPTFAQYLDLPSTTLAFVPTPSINAVGATSTAPAPAWRVVRPRGGELHTELSQRNWLLRGALGASGGERGWSGYGNGYVASPLGGRGHGHRDSDDEEDEEEEEGEEETTFFSIADADGDSFAEDEGDDDEGEAAFDALHVAGKDTTGYRRGSGGRRSISSRTDPSDSDINEEGSLSSSSPADTNPKGPPSSSSITNHIRYPTSVQSMNLRISAPNLKPLASLPSASHVLRIAPTTLKVDIIAAVISIEPTEIKLVQPWRGQAASVVPEHTRTRALVKVVLGDETKAGFGVTFWVPATTEEGGSVEGGGDRFALRSRLESLRSCDVVLLRNVKLSQYLGQLKGNSVATGDGWRSEWSTSVVLLCRRGAGRRNEANEQGVVYDSEDLEEGVGGTEDDQQSKRKMAEVLVKEKAGRVKEWMRRFVVVPGVAARSGKRRSGKEEHGRGVAKKRRGLVEQRGMVLPPDETPVR